LILPNDTTVAVADGNHMRLFRNKGMEPEIRLVALPDPRIDAVNQGSGARHRSGAANPDAQRLDEDDFAAAAATYLNRQVLEGKIGALYIIADPRTLGEMRLHLHEAVASKLVGELARNLTGHSLEGIEIALARA
jgi:protein required for attachment to host cells